MEQNNSREDFAMHTSNNTISPLSYHLIPQPYYSVSSILWFPHIHPVSLLNTSKVKLTTSNTAPTGIPYHPHASPQVSPLISTI